MEAGSGAGERTAANHFSSPGGVRSRHGIAGGGAGGGASESDASTRLENSMLFSFLSRSKSYILRVLSTRVRPFADLDPGTLVRLPDVQLYCTHTAHVQSFNPGKYPP